MRLGLFGVNTGIFATDPAALVSVARAAERAGWDSVWTGEHFVLPDPRVPDSPLRPGTPMLDPWIALAAIATHTETLLLATGITVVPLYQPAALAKQVASLDRLCAGRFLFGVGVGYLAEEFAAFGVPLAGRGAATDEALDVLAALWREPAPRVRFRDRTISGVGADPRPLRTGGPPLIVGGNGPAAFRRAARRGAGWYGWFVTPEQTAAAAAAIRAEERPAGWPAVEITVTPPRDRPLDGALAREYTDAGASRLVINPHVLGLKEPAAITRLIESTPDALGLSG